MLVRPNNRVAEALLSLSTNQQWQMVEEWLSSEKVRLNQILVRETDPTQIGWLQGAIQFLDDFQKKKAQVLRNK